MHVDLLVTHASQLLTIPAHDRGPQRGDRLGDLAIIADGAGLKNGGNNDAAKLVGEAIGKKAIGLGITEVVFDRNGFKYHGRIKALADGAPEAGLKF